jgi:hypothetical protein
MDIGFSSKVLSVTVKELKKAELDYRAIKTKVYITTSYEFITVVVRVIKLTPHEIKITDQTAVLKLCFSATIFRKAIDPILGQYYKMTFFPKTKKNNSNTGDSFAF